MFVFFGFNFLNVMLFADCAFVFDIIRAAANFVIFVVEFIITAVAPDSAVSVKVSVTAAGAADILSFRNGIGDIEHVPVRKIIGGKTFSREKCSVNGIHPAGVCGKISRKKRTGRCSGYGKPIAEDKFPKFRRNFRNAGISRYSTDIKSAFGRAVKKNFNSYIIRGGKKSFCGGVALQNLHFIFADYSKTRGGGVDYNVCKTYSFSVFGGFEFNFIFTVGGVSLIVPGKNRYKMTVLRPEIENIFKS